MIIQNQILKEDKTQGCRMFGENFLRAVERNLEKNNSLIHYK